MIRRFWLRLQLAARLRRLVRFAFTSLVIAAFLLLFPVAYVEMRCREKEGPQRYRPIITEAAFQRPEANTYLAYPEWHVVYAYDGLAHVLKTGDEHAFEYLGTVARYWSTACELTRDASRHGAAGWGTRSRLHTIGVSFTADMFVKGAYEETIGRFTAWLRGPQKTAQDAAIAATVADYAASLHQAPWYRYPFAQKAHDLWTPPAESLRAWERRLGIGLEFEVKAVSAKVIERAVAATGEAQLVVRSVVSGIDAKALERIQGVKVIGRRGDGVEIETPRSDSFTRILVEIARQGGTIREIAGNDEIMVSLTIRDGGSAPAERGTIIDRMPRDGMPGQRLLLNVEMAELAAFLRAHAIGDPGLERVFDY